MNGDYFRLCEEIANAIEDAIEDIVFTNEGGETVYMGADGTPTKRIDNIAETAALRVLEEQDCPARLVSEEIGEIKLVDNPEFTIVLDPVDGTYNAVHGIPFYSASIALARGDGLSDVFYGYVKNLASGTTYHATREEGAYCNGTRLNVSNTDALGSFSVSAYGYRPGGERIIALSQSIRRIRTMGASSLELCLVAAGDLDAYVDTRHILRVTDVAAGKLIVEEAGGLVTDAAGAPLHAPLQVVARVDVIASNNKVHERLIGKLRGR